ncbi:hypothetical protein NHQ30_011623 [Ciborinia camelliae]|nr:hypothetical protein NHQ30_011623 [Ciborinia camelliae]
MAPSQAPAEPIALVGMSCRLPGDAFNTSELWDPLAHGRSGLRDIPKSRFNVDAFYHPESNKAGTISAKEAKYMDPQQRQLLEVAYECFESAGITLEDAPGANIGSYVAKFTTGFVNIQAKDPDLYHRYNATGFGPTILANQIGHTFAGHQPLLIGSVKPNLCHGGVVSGITSIIKATLALEHEIIPPTIGIRDLNPQLKFKKRNIRVVMTSELWPAAATEGISVNSFGYGGANAHAIIDSARTIVFPATAYLEMAIEGLFQAHDYLTEGKITLKQVHLLNLLVLEAEGDGVELTIQLEPARLSSATTSEIWWRFEICSRAANVLTVHANGLIAAMEEQSTKTWYNKLAKEGSCFGPEFHSLVEIKTDRGKRHPGVLAKTTYRQGSGSGAYLESDYVINPVTIDVMLQAAIVGSAAGIVHDFKGKIPVMLSEFDVFPGKITNASEICNIETRCRKVGFESVLLSGELQSPDGKLLARMKDVRVIPYKEQTLQNSTERNPCLRILWKPSISTLTSENSHVFTSYLEQFKGFLPSQVKGNDMASLTGAIDLVTHSNERAKILELSHDESNQLGQSMIVAGIGGNQKRFDSYMRATIMTDGSITSDTKKLKPEHVFNLVVVSSQVSTSLALNHFDDLKQYFAPNTVFAFASDSTTSLSLNQNQFSLLSAHSNDPNDSKTTITIARPISTSFERNISPDGSKLILVCPNATLSFSPLNHAIIKSTIRVSQNSRSAASFRRSFQRYAPPTLNGRLNPRTRISTSKQYDLHSTRAPNDYLRKCGLYSLVDRRLSLQRFKSKLCCRTWSFPKQGLQIEKEEPLSRGYVEVQDYDVLSDKVDLQNGTCSLEFSGIIRATNSQATSFLPGDCVSVLAPNYGGTRLAHLRSIGLPGISLGLGMVSEVGFLHERPDTEAVLLRKGLHPLTEDEFLQVIDGAINSLKTADESEDTAWGKKHHMDGHILTGLELQGFQKHRDMGFVRGVVVLEDPRFTYMAGAFAASGPTSNNADTADGSNFPRAVAAALAMNDNDSLPSEELTEAIANVVISRISTLLLVPAAQLQTTTLLSDFGMESMLAAEFRSDMFRAFRVDVPFAILMAQGTQIQSIAELVGQSLLEQR